MSNTRNLLEDLDSREAQAQPVAGINNDIELSILRYLTLKDLHLVSRVSKAWNEKAQKILSKTEKPQENNDTYISPWGALLVRAIIDNNFDRVSECLPHLPFSYTFVPANTYQAEEVKEDVTAKAGTVELSTREGREGSGPLLIYKCYHSAEPSISPTDPLVAEREGGFIAPEEVIIPLQEHLDDIQRPLLIQILRKQEFKESDQTQLRLFLSNIPSTTHLCGNADIFINGTVPQKRAYLYRPLLKHPNLLDIAFEHTSGYEGAKIITALLKNGANGAGLLRHNNFTKYEPICPTIKAIKYIIMFENSLPAPDDTRSVIQGKMHRAFDLYLTTALETSPVVTKNYMDALKNHPSFDGISKRIDKKSLRDNQRFVFLSSKGNSEKFVFSTLTEIARITMTTLSSSLTPFVAFSSTVGKVTNNLQDAEKMLKGRYIDFPISLVGAPKSIQKEGYNTTLFFKHRPLAPAQDALSAPAANPVSPNLN